LKFRRKVGVHFATKNSYRPPLAVPLPPWVELAPLAVGLLSVAVGFDAVVLAGPDLTRVSVLTPVPAAGLADWLAVVPEPAAPAAF
jgi:hypothetical protein